MNAIGEFTERGKTIKFTINDNVVVSVKPRGFSPIEHMSAIKKYIGFTGKSCFVGRLDQMARGLMMYMLDSKTKFSRQMCKADKIYEFELCLGFSTDSQDCMGEINATSLDYTPSNVTAIVDDIKKGRYTSYTQTFPHYSSFRGTSRVTGEKKPLWLWTVEGRIDEVDIPTKEIDVEDFQVLGTRTVNAKTHIESTISDIDSVTSIPRDRLDHVINGWNNIIGTITSVNTITLIRCSVKVKSGTYIRFLADMIGRDHGIPSYAYDINRTEVFYDEIPSHP